MTCWYPLDKVKGELLHATGTDLGGGGGCSKQLGSRVMRRWMVEAAAREAADSISSLPGGSAS